MSLRMATLTLSNFDNLSGVLKLKEAVANGGLLFSTDNLNVSNVLKLKESRCLWPVAVPRRQRE